MSLHRCACSHDCPEGCSLLVETRAVPCHRCHRRSRQPLHPGQICAKMRRLPHAVNSPERILTPLRRAGKKGEGRFVPISWTRRWRRFPPAGRI